LPWRHCPNGKDGGKVEDDLAEPKPTKFGRSDIPGTIEKVTTFITRFTARGTDLLVFEHPHAGIQIPAGTVEQGETLEQAALREAHEETGLMGLSSCEYLGRTEDHFTGKHRLILEPTKAYARSDAASFDWAQFRKGLPVTLTGHHANGFSQVMYEEWDRWPDPQYVTYSIVGWVPDEMLCDTIRRHFFYLEAHSPTQERWIVHIDNHRFVLFWAPLTNLPAIIQPQDTWLEFLLKARALPKE
jgi:8-oxo-dGTP pyrophosphatase MutT (NUDIX family)